MEDTFELIGNRELLMLYKETRYLGKKITELQFIIIPDQKVITWEEVKPLLSLSDQQIIEMEIEEIAANNIELLKLYD